MIAFYKELVQRLENMVGNYVIGREPSVAEIARTQALSARIKSGSKLKRVYVSGPITKGNRTTNFYQGCQAQKLLMESGEYAVMNPMLTIMHPDEPNISWDCWLATDLAFIEVCDELIRLPGESRGGDRETAYAREIGIPVVEACDVPCLKVLFKDDNRELTGLTI
jgi:hypothetical protein